MNELAIDVMKQITLQEEGGEMYVSEWYMQYSTTQVKDTCTHMHAHHLYMYTNRYFYI